MIAPPVTDRSASVAAVAAAAADLRRLRHRQRRRSFVMLTVLGLLGVAAFVGSIALAGSVTIPLSDIPAALMGRADPVTQFVITDKRLPRALVALLVGLLFGLSGVLYQRLIGNVLATPDVLGVSAGAGAGAVAAIVLGVGGLGVTAGSLVGAGAAVLVIFGLASGAGSTTYRLILVGIGVAACCAAVTSYMLTLTDEMATNRAMRWLIGSLNGSTWVDVRLLLVAAVVLLPLAGALSPDLDTVRLGDSVAAGLGTRVAVLRVTVLLLGASAAAVATSVGGPLAFVALVAGPLVARILPAAGLWPAALLGAVLVAASDLMAQAAPVISPVPTGVITALLGAPALVYLLIARRVSR